MKKITLQLSVDSCKQAIAELKKYQKEIVPKLKEVCKRLAEIGLAEAQANLYFDNENDEAWLSVEPIADGYKIVMSGEDVYFIEFGTGDATDKHGYDTFVPVYPGSYSEKHAQRYSKYGFWYYNRVKYTETPAYMPMYHAGKKMREELPRVVREVFG